LRFKKTGKIALFSTKTLSNNGKTPANIADAFLWEIIDFPHFVNFGEEFRKKGALLAKKVSP
jgi:hypothetical protein